MNYAHFVNNLTLASEVSINAHIPRTSRLVIGIRPGTCDIVGSCQIARGLGITRTPQTFVEQVVHAAGQTDILGHIPGRAQAIPMLYGLISLLRSNRRTTFIVVFFGCCLPHGVKVVCIDKSSRACQLSVEFNVYLDDRQTVARGFVFTLSAYK